MHMKRTPIIARIYRHDQIKMQNSNSQNRFISNNSMGKKHKKTRRLFKSIKAAAKKLAGVFNFFLVWQRKSISNRTEADARKNKHGRFREIPSSEGKNLESRSRNKSPWFLKALGDEKIGKGDFSMAEIYKATGNFSAVNKIGEGGFSSVYKAKLNDGTFLAVKRLKKDLYDEHLSNEFKNEIITLSQIEHLNLVKFFGFLEQGDEQLILVEYVGNGTLREHLDDICGNGLEIAERLDIAIDVAHAVTYLHTYTDEIHFVEWMEGMELPTGCQLLMGNIRKFKLFFFQITDHPIIHRDIKASNILITDKLRAKVADFGLARLASKDSGVTHISTEVKGTAGYLDPDYLMTYQLTEKSDVYSFGVLLIELISGRQPVEPKKSHSERETIKWALKKLKGGEPIMVMDPRLQRSPASMLVVEKVLKLARHCLALSRKSRPPMKKCAEVLWRIRKDYNEKCLSTAALTYHNSENIVEGGCSC